MATIVIKNIGEILTGDIAKPVAEGNTIVVVDGKISAVGGEAVDLFDLRMRGRAAEEHREKCSEEETKNVQMIHEK